MNVATSLFALDDPRIAEFMSQLDTVNALAEQSPGFVWRLKSASGNATDIKVTDDPRFIVNMSVWQDVASLFDFVYKSSHRLVMAKRREWFEQPTGSYQVLWWAEAGVLPTVADGLERLNHLDRHGPTAHAFTFKQVFAPPGARRDRKPAAAALLRRLGIAQAQISISPNRDRCRRGERMG
jgi:hypothetical protein